MNQVYTNAGEVKATYKKSRKKNQIKEIVINSSRSVSDFVKSVYPVDVNYQEAFCVLYLNRANKTVGFSVISTGGVSGVMVDKKLIFQQALLTHSSSIILIHNHPSGTLKPSGADVELTKSVKGGAKLLDIEVLDHVIITENSYYSFADEGLI